MLRLRWIVRTRCGCWRYWITWGKVRGICGIRIRLEWWLSCCRSGWRGPNGAGRTDMMHRGDDMVHCIYGRRRHWNIRWRKCWRIIRIIRRKSRSRICREVWRHIHWFHRVYTIRRWTSIRGNCNCFYFGRFSWRNCNVVSVHK